MQGVRPLTISFKNQLCKQNGLLPKLTLISYLRLPITINKAFRGDHFGYTITLAGRHDLSSKIKLYSNLGVTQDQESTDISYLSALEINYNITEKFSAFTEYFGNYGSHTSAVNGLDIGFVYAVKNNLAVDLAFGSPTLKLNTARYISLWASIRLPK
ncbi:MAG TPA: transporter [Chitinophagaceae bacterium]|nr:transporter [Chitinophagaceae bacterium]